MKRMVALFLVLLLSIESFGAVVSDNDGSAFITKAEFDSLKNDFQSQINKYNTSIDSKIDGAIASYLAGINLAKTIEQTNLYNNIRKKKEIYWVSSDTWSMTNSKPIPKVIYEFDQAFNTTAYKLTTSRAAQNTWMFEGVVKAGFYYVDYEMELDSTFEEHESYLLADQSFSSIPNAAYDPEDVQIVRKIYLVNPSEYLPHNYSPNGSGSSRGNFRGIFSAYFYKEDKDEKGYLRFAPWSTANTYVHISNNKDKMTTPSHTAWQYYPYGSGPTPTLTDMRSDTSKQTVNPTSASKSSSNSIKLLNFHSGGIYIPWMQQTFVMNQILYNVVVDVTGEDYQIRCGVKICNATDDGKVKIKLTSDKPGVGVFHIGEPITGWPKTANVKDEINKIYSTKSLAANEQGTIEFECKKNDRIWFVFAGTNGTDNCKVDINEIMLTQDS